ncbi:tyrosine-type recombinase/integrase [Sabulicella glaciei]|uniref:Integrase arm-type DNA-binding domain-containing protein n=1 Tax=Sabulicella glaciei TaxID=2984948 RepID=A0ABT3NYG2_9PROT|nr:site-specific integrase [Roseococcus sp. MDT2-1-1]MCW8086604.1 integrase arm-type DNA-binding domain-containing protein [Roseococcus sp. MDT2-1-1]
MAGKLTAAAVRGLVAKGKPGATADGGGLYLRVTAPGAGKWTLRYMLAGKSREMGLGSAAEVSLAEARIKAEALRPALRAGTDPLEARRAEAEAASRAAAAATSFEAAARHVCQERAAGWRNPKHAAQWLTSLETHAFPLIGAKPVSSIGTEDVLAVLRPIWTRVPETASRVRGRLENVLDAARVKGWRSGENPARWRGHLAALLPQARKVRAVRHHPSLPVQRMPAFMAALARHHGAGALALRFAILTAARSGEARKTTWGEVDLEHAVWVVPGARMKGGIVHRVPLPGPALDLLRAIRPAKPDPKALIFPTTANTAPSDMTLLAVVRRMNQPSRGAEASAPLWVDKEGRAIVPHGFRATFKGWTLARGYPDHLGERALAHVDHNEARAAYARDDLLEERRPMMEAWAAFCTAPAASVADLASARAQRAGA